MTTPELWVVSSGRYIPQPTQIKKENRFLQGGYTNRIQYMLSKQQKGGGGASASVSPDNEGSSITEKMPKSSGKHSADTKNKCARAAIKKGGANRRRNEVSDEGQFQQQ